MTDIDFSNEDIFGDDIDLDEIPDNPNHLPADVYICVVVGAEMKPTNNGDKVGLTIKYQITEGNYSSWFPFQEWLWVVRKKKGEELTAEESKATSRLKRHFLAWGYGADEMKGVKPADLIGKTCKVKTWNKKDDKYGERVNVNDIYPLDDDDVSVDGLTHFSSKVEDSI